MSPINHSVKLISMTQPVGENDFNTITELLAYIARVSNPANQDNKLTATRLLSYLVKHNHWSPFEMVDLTMEIICSRAIARQILRHKTFSFQEFSQRYAQVSEDMFVKQAIEARLQDNKNRQNSIETDDQTLIHEWNKIQEDHISDSIRRYVNALNLGVAKEQARAVLPEGLTMSRMYMKGNLRSWIHYIQVRTDPSTQKEHRLIAEDCANIICNEVPPLQGIYPFFKIEEANP